MSSETLAESMPKLMEALLSRKRSVTNSPVAQVLFQLINYFGLTIIVFKSTIHIKLRVIRLQTLSWASTVNKQGRAKEMSTFVKFELHK